MIQAENPTQENQISPGTTTTKVHGFSTTNTPLPNPQQEIHPHHQSTFAELFFIWWHKIAIVLLTLHALIGLWESIKFIAIEYPKLDQQLSLHLINSEKVNHLLASAIIIATITTFNIIIAIRLSKIKETTAHNIDLIVATIIILSTSYIQKLLIELDLFNLIQNYLK